jgi:SAM-dependent methyltransferase
MKIENKLELNEIQRLKNLHIESLADELVAKRKENIIKGLFGELPIESIQSQFTGLSQKQTFVQALTYLNLCDKIATAQHHAFERNGPSLVVDFGSGWGRITQLLSLYFDPKCILGCDVLDMALEEVKRNRVRGAFKKIESWPPSCIRDESVDYIFSYSVFSHLSEDNSFAWIREFFRILKPGGMAFLTTRHKSFFNYLENLHKNSNIPCFANGAHRAFRDINAAKQDYDNGRFCFDADGGGGKGLTPVYGEAFIPPKYVIEYYGKIFSAVGFEDPIPEGLLDQATIWLQK